MCYKEKICLVYSHVWWNVHFLVKLVIAYNHCCIITVTGLCAGNSPVTGEFPSQRPVTDLKWNGSHLILSYLIFQVNVTVLLWWKFLLNRFGRVCTTLCPLVVAAQLLTYCLVSHSATDITRLLDDHPHPTPTPHHHHTTHPPPLCKKSYMVMYVSWNIQTYIYIYIL